MVTVPTDTELILNDSDGMADGGAVPVEILPEGVGMLSDTEDSGTITILETFAEGAGMLEETFPDGTGMVPDAEDNGAVPKLENVVFDGAEMLAEADGDGV